jgi:hypothetical protein
MVSEGQMASEPALSEAEGAETDPTKGPHLTAVGRSGTERAATRIKNFCARKLPLNPRFVSQICA